MAQFAAGTVGVPFEKVTMVTSDSATMGNPGSASASRMTFMSGNAIRGAAEAALAKWKAEERPAIAEYTYLAPKTTPFDKETGYSTPNLSYAYAAQAVEVEVDLETGFIKILRVVSADDVGQAINPALVQGQIEGAVVQAEGYALTENFISHKRAHPDRPAQHLPDPHRARHPGCGRIGHPRSGGAKRTLWGARAGRITIPAAGAGHCRCTPRCHWCLVQRIPAYARACTARVGENLNSFHSMDAKDFLI